MTLFHRIRPPAGLMMVIAILIVLLVGLWFWREVRIDRCLDAGGRWHSKGCDGA
jgi:hypothetical protein